MPEAEWTSAQSKQVRAIVKFAIERCPYYRDSIGSKGLTGNWAEVPLLTSEDLRVHLPPNGNGLLSGEPATHVFASGATGGEPKYILRSIGEYPGYVPAIAESLRRTGLRRGDVVANLFHCGSLYTSFLFFEELLRAGGCCSLPLGADEPFEAVLKVFKMFPPGVLGGTPSRLTRLAECAIALGAKLSVRIVYYGSEALFPSQRQLLEQAFGTSRIFSACYAGTDYGPVGYDCGQAPSRVHHIFEQQSFVEVVDPMTGANLADGEVGSIVVTSLHRFVVPIIRYVTGDLGKILIQRCVCGSTHRLLQLNGRQGSELRIVTEDVNVEMMAGWLAEILGRHRPFRVTAEMENTTQVLRVVVESDRGSRQFQEECEQALAIRFRSLIGGDLASGFKVCVNFAPVGSVLADPRTGKTRYFEDQRFRDTE